MCESKIELDGEEIVAEAAKIEVSEGKLNVFDILGGKIEIENAKIKVIDFIGHTTRLTKK